MHSFIVLFRYATCGYFDWIKNLLRKQSLDDLSMERFLCSISLLKYSDIICSHILNDSNVRKTGNVVTLNYEEVEWITQPYATRTGGTGDIMNVNPYEPRFEIQSQYISGGDLTISFHLSHLV